MKHTTDELLGIVYQHYPRGIENDDPRWQPCAEHGRLVSARKAAAADPRWPALLRRISARHRVTNQSLHLPTGALDGCYSFSVEMPGRQHRGLWFHASFLAPYHVAYSLRRVEDVERTAMMRGCVEQVVVEVQGVSFALPRSCLHADLLAELDEDQRRAAPVERDELVFALPPDEETIAVWICREIETCFGSQAMSPDVRTIVVPDVATNMRRLGEATLFDCLFRDDQSWVRRPRPPAVAVAHIDASRMPASFIPVATVLAAAATISGLALTPHPGSTYAVMEMDGKLEKRWLLDLLAKAEAVDSPATGDILLAVRALHEAATGWDAQVAPSDAMVAAALRVLAR